MGTLSQSQLASSSLKNIGSKVAALSFSPGEEIVAQIGDRRISIKTARGLGGYVSLSVQVDPNTMRPISIKPDTTAILKLDKRYLLMTLLASSSPPAPQK
jgi:hypothetical protein